MSSSSSEQYCFWGDNSGTGLGHAILLSAGSRQLPRLLSSLAFIAGISQNTFLIGFYLWIVSPILLFTGAYIECLRQRKTF